MTTDAELKPARIKPRVKPYLVNFGQKTCDDCRYQEGRHYCLLLSFSMKNMDLKRCREWKAK